MKKRYVTLDGMRGLAAIAVVAFHLVPQFHLDLPQPNGPMAVTFFFCLSGFVLAQAHDEQLLNGALSLWRFMKMRSIRVGPMICAGSILGALSLPVLHEPFAPPHWLWWQTSLLSLIALPTIYGGRIYWVNGVFWSLFAELLVNFLYGAIGTRLRSVLLAVVVAISGASLAIIAFKLRNLNFHFEVLKDVVPTALKAMFGFFAGVGVSRALKTFEPKFVSPTWAPIILLATMLALPPVHFRFELIETFVLVPSVVALGALTEPPRPHGLVILGALSFPLYAIHSPILVMAEAPVMTLTTTLRYVVSAAFLLGLPVLAFIIDRYIDEPGRAYLRQAILRK